MSSNDSGMKKAIIWALLSLVAFSAISICCVRLFAMETSSDFAAEAFLEFHYADNDISVTIKDEGDILALKRLLNGYPFGDSPACGFTTDISITMASGNKSIFFCPACDGCPLLLVDGSGKYIEISNEARAELNDVLEKYGMTFPCVG